MYAHCSNVRCSKRSNAFRVRRLNVESEYPQTHVCVVAVHVCNSDNRRVTRFSLVRYLMCRYISHQKKSNAKLKRRKPVLDGLLRDVRLWAMLFRVCERSIRVEGVFGFV